MNTRPIHFFSAILCGISSVKGPRQTKALTVMSKKLARALFGKKNDPATGTRLSEVQTSNISTIKRRQSAYFMAFLACGEKIERILDNNKYGSRLRTTRGGKNSSDFAIFFN
jgi:hypothetical protein